MSEEEPKLRPTDTRCIFCNDTGVMNLVSGFYKCYCVSKKEVSEQQTYGTDCPNGSCDN